MADAVNIDLVRQKVQARELARAAMQLAAAELQPLPEEARLAFLEELRDYAEARLPPRPPMVPATALQALTEEEARAFERVQLPFGQYTGFVIGAVMRAVDGPRYLAWLADQRFIDRLRLYLRRPEVQQRLPETEEDEDDVTSFGARGAE